MNRNELPQALQTLLEISRINVVSVGLTASENTWTADCKSKIGGIGYLPENEIYPRNEDGEPLALLFQLNFAEIAEQVDISQLKYELPKQGMLQVYIGMNDYYGSDLDEWDNRYPTDNYQVRFWQNIGNEVNSDELIVVRDYFTSFHLEYFDEFLPFNIHWQFTMDFKLTEQSCILDSHDYEKFAKQSIPELIDIDSYDFCEQLGIVDSLDTYFKTIGNEYRKMAKPNLHGILGYPDFTQDDPRKWEDCDYKDNICLLKIESEYKDDVDVGIAWGDCGIANFFIHPDDLKNTDFSKLVYYWDCS